MCDFAADAAAAEQLMVGRTLSVARVRELNAKDYFYQMLKDNPEMLKIYPGIENGLLKGAIDCHIHAYPDFVNRSQDMIQIAIHASKARMRALAFKDHWNVSANAAYLAQRHLDFLIENGELAHRGNLRWRGQLTRGSAADKMVSDTTERASNCRSRGRLRRAGDGMRRPQPGWAR